MDELKRWNPDGWGRPGRVAAASNAPVDSTSETRVALLEGGVELIEQPFAAEDLDSFRALRADRPGIPIVVDEGCHTLRDVAAVAGYADGVNIKLAKAGGVREALRMVHAARALGLRVMLGCMVESTLGIAAAAQIASLCDHVDLDGHLLIADDPFAGLGLEQGALVLSDAPGLGVSPR